MAVCASGPSVQTADTTTDHCEIWMSAEQMECAVWTTATVNSIGDHAKGETVTLLLVRDEDGIYASGDMMPG